MDSTNIIPVYIEEEMRGSYMDYAMSVIVGRAIPDARDGLKPVHRRILYAMLREGILSSRKLSKCAGVVGEVLKKYHPHGDSAVYDALVRMAQPWNLRYPLIQGQGNFGSVDGDSPAAYRYTECRLNPLAESMMLDIDKDTVDFEPNFDDSTEEPVVVPTRIPALLINGAEGIAVGMASRIPPHNLTEVVSAAIAVVQNPEITLNELMEIVPGPDFPTGGTIYGAAPLKQAYHNGRGLIKIRGKHHIETLKSKGKEVEAIVIDEIPYQVNKSKLVEKIAELVNDKKIEGVSKLRDESDRHGMRIVIELKRDGVVDVVLNLLYKLTQFQRSFGINMLSIVDGRPKTLGLKGLLECFVRHRREVVVRRTRFDLEKAKARLHILEGLRIALDNIDEVIALIRGSESTAVAKEALIARFSLSDIQAQQILDMPLRRLTGLERKAIEDEHKEVSERIEALAKILSDPAEVNKVVVEELEEVKEKFGDKRRTEIEEHGDEIEIEDLIVEEDMMVSISHRGYAKRSAPSLYRSQNRGGKGVMGTKKLSDGDDDFVSELFIASTHAYLLIFTDQGKLHWLKVYRLPEAGRTARGRAIVNILNLGKEEKITAILPVRNFEEGKYVVMLTRRGYIKRVDLMAFSNVRNGGIRATSLDEGDELIASRITDGESDFIVVTKHGMAIRFSETDVRAMGRTARGVRAVNLGDGDQVAGIASVSAEEGSEEGQRALLTVCEGGYGKRTAITEYRCQSRGGKGVIDIKTKGRNGPVAGAAMVSPGDDAMFITTAGKVIRIPVDGVSVIGRNTMGVSIINLDEGESVAAMARLADQSNGEDEEGGEGEEGGGE